MNFSNNPVTIYPDCISEKAPYVFRKSKWWVVKSNKIIKNT